jgi:hypothetical protein
MKTLKEYLLESKKTYSFKIGVAGDLPEGFESKLKMALEKYSIAEFKKIKTTPIQERPLDFPQLENTNVTFFEVSLHYPSTEAILEEYLGSFCDVERSHLIVRNPNAPAEEIKDIKEPETYESILTKEKLEDTSAQNSVGQSRIMDLLKELETARKERPDRAESGFKIEASKPEPQNTKSVVGN